MKLSPQKELILSHLRNGEWVCQTAWLGAIKDDRKRISELNAGYMKEKGYEIIGEQCDGRCGKEHSSGLFMRRAVKIPHHTTFQESAKDKTKEEYEAIGKRKGRLFDMGAPAEVVLGV